MADTYKRVLGLDLELQFDQSSGKIHQKRLNAIRDAALKAVDAAITEQLPDIPVEVRSQMTWSYRWREESQNYELGLALDDDDAK